MQLRLFQTLNEISSENNSTVILPVPLDMFRPFAGAGDGYRPAKPPEVQRREEKEAERLYEEAAGENKGAEEVP